MTDVLSVYHKNFIQKGCEGNGSNLCNADCEGQEVLC